MNYYFTASKWYGPLPEPAISLEFIESLPSGDSLIPQFAGMVKEENKDFKWEIHCDEEFGCTCSIVGLDSEKCSHPYKVAVPIAEEKLSWQEEVIAREEEGKQTFSEEDINKVQEDIDSVNRGRVIDKFKLLGIPYLDETKQLLSEVYQVMTGFSQDDVWSDYDESVRRRVVEMQQKLENI